MAALSACAAPTAASSAVEHLTLECVAESGAWTASVDEPRGGEGGTIRALDGPEQDGSWILLAAGADRLDVEREIESGDLPVEVTWYDRPRLISPNGGCTIYLLPPPDDRSRRVLVVGDSIAYGMVGYPDRERATAAQAFAQGYTFSVDGYSGSTWGYAGEPGRRPEDRLRGAAATDPTVPVVVVLGANDAGWAALTERLAGRGTGPDAASVRAATARSLMTWVPRLVDGGRCVVLVTAPDRPITSYGLGDAYVLDATRLNDLIEQVARLHGAIVAPFAELSRPHHGADGEAGSWFDEDQLHPNAIGTRSLVAAVLDALDDCPTT